MDDNHSDQQLEEHHVDGEGHAHHQFDPEHAEQFRDPDRVAKLRLEDLVKEIELREGHRVMDIGTGTGVALPVLSETVGPEGSVVALDIEGRMLKRAQSFTEQDSLGNVELVENERGSIPEEDGTVDRVVIISSLHEFARPQAMLKECARVLVPEGMIGILEWRHEETEDGPPLDHRLAPETIEGWLREANLTPLQPVEWSGGYQLYLGKS